MSGRPGRLLQSFLSWFQLLPGWMDEIFAKRDRIIDAQDVERRAEETEREKFDALIDKFWREIIGRLTKRISKYNGNVAEREGLCLSGEDDLKIEKGSHPPASLSICLIRPFRIVSCSIDGEPSNYTKYFKVVAGEVGLRLEVWTGEKKSGKVVKDVEEELLREFLTRLLVTGRR